MDQFTVDFLKKLDLDMYVDVFKDNFIGEEILFKMRDEDIKELIKPVGHRIKFLFALRKKRANSDSDETDCTSPSKKVLTNSNMSEILKNTNKNKKSPISILNEYCQKAKEPTPVFSISVNDLEADKERFKCTVQFKSLSVEAFANSKHEAKTKAASAMLDKISESNDNPIHSILVDLMNSTNNSTSTNNGTTEDEKTNLNYVGKLEEYCVKHKIALPVYKCCELSSKPHEPVFDFTCEIASLNISSTGQGKSKQFAKKQAAKMALEYLYQREERKNDDNEQ